MTPRLRKFVLVTHITSSVGWIGAVAAFLALAITGLTSQDAEMVRGAYLAMEVTAWVVILPLAVSSLLVGIIQALGTPWGLFRHYWVLVKLLITVLAFGVLLAQLAPISYLAAQTTLSGTDLFDARISLVVHAGGGLLVLLVPAAMSVYKPRGRTRYGQRKQREQLPRPIGPVVTAGAQHD